jgi:hypothetical protein
MEIRIQHTRVSESLSKPANTRDHYRDVDEAEIGDDGDNIYIHLLINLQVLDVDAI